MSEHSHRLYDESEAEPFFKALTYELNRMYDMEPKSSSSSLLMVIFIVGGFIVTSLTYAGWKKYKGEKSVSEADSLTSECFLNKIVIYHPLWR